MNYLQIKNYEGLYDIYENGEIYSFPKPPQNTKGKFIKSHIDNRGYLRVILIKSGQRKTFKVHRLVAENFLSNPLELKEVNHKDGNKINNHHSNLEWCTRSHNIKHADLTGLRIMPKGSKVSRAKLTEEIVISIRKEYSESNTTQQQLADKYKVARSLIYRIIHNQSWNHI